MKLARIYTAITSSTKRKQLEERQQLEQMPNSDIIDWNGADILSEPVNCADAENSETNPYPSEMTRSPPTVEITKLTKPVPTDFTKLDLFTVYMTTINRLADCPLPTSLDPQGVKPH